MSLAKLDEGNAQKEYEEPSGENMVPRDNGHPIVLFFFAGPFYASDLPRKT